MWKSTQCSNCQNETFARVDEVDVFCDKCEELVSLRNKVERYKQALIEIESFEGMTAYEAQSIAQEALITE